MSGLPNCNQKHATSRQTCEAFFQCLPSYHLAVCMP